MPSPTQRVVLITGVSRYLGGHLAERLAADSSVERIIGIDTIAPRTSERPRLGRTEFVRADIRNPLIAKVISQARVDTVVHTAALASPRAPRVTLQDQYVTGTMQLLAACQTSESIRRVVVASTTAVYGASAADPALFTEEMPPTGQAVGYARSSIEVENYARGFARRRPDIPLSVLRLANLIGPTVDTALTRYLSMPIVPTSLGYDARLQLLHEWDAIEALHRASAIDHRGVVNVAGEGVVSLAQAVRRAGRLRLPVPSPAVALVGAAVRNSGVAEVSAEKTSFLNYGRVVDTTRLRTQFGYTPRYTTEEALRDYVEARSVLPRLVLGAVEGAQHRLQDRLERLASAAARMGAI
ncbi:NAD-dependent epimerase/dehydratase family protein [Jatrophihabitans sp.]|uniref:NAD-dependent epimerase/dehydratase family protein n=1 Tax=Jatrophihabitans sp. TaxID=1932789 RepID=UPI0030C77CE5|nr:NAD-dependent epimerase/dehydratase [Jatrophihabitans sp.]